MPAIAAHAPNPSSLRTTDATETTIQVPQHDSAAWGPPSDAVVQQDGGEELRYDEADGEAYPRASFIEVYGYEDGIEAWRSARVARPSQTMVSPVVGAIPMPESACTERRSSGVPNGLGVDEALQLVPWNVAYGRVMSI